MKPNLANCELTKDFPSVTSPLSPPCSADLRYPVMESNERHKKVTDWQGTSEKSLWQWSPSGRDFTKFTVKDKDEYNLQIQKHVVERELFILNLEQCTEDNDCYHMNRGSANENQCHEESEYEETEHKLFLPGGMFQNDLYSEDGQLAPEIDEKSDAEKEKGEKDGEEKDYYEKDGEEKEMDENEITNKDSDEREADDEEKSENEEAEKDLNKMGTEKKNTCDEVKTIECFSRDVTAGETLLDSGYYEIEVLTENPEDGQLELIEIELTQRETKERIALVSTLNSSPEDLSFDAKLSGSADKLLSAILPIRSSITGFGSLPMEEEMSGSCMDSEVIIKEKLQKQLASVLIATGAEMVPSNIQPMSLLLNIEQKWKNISNFTISRVGQEPVNSEQYRGGSGDRSDKSSQGNCGNGGGGGSQDAACGSSGEGFLSMAGNPSSGGCGSGCGGGGDEDGNKRKKENFRFSDSADEEKTKQEKELKKKSRLEKGDLCPFDSVTYGNEEKLRTMAVAWGERSEHIRHNPSFARRCSAGVILDSYKNEFFINEDGYQEDLHWVKTIGNLSPLGCGTVGKCYPCTDLETGTIFCVKEIQLLNFYDSEITILLDLDNPGVVKLYGAIFSDEKVYILLELIYGPTLQEVLDKKERYYLNALECMRQLLKILEYLESCGVIHDDVKADNIMFREGDSNTIVLIDFGLAKKASHIEEGTIPRGSECGMSPEKAASKGYNAKADVWAATAVLVHMLSGDAPWTIMEKSPPLEDVPHDTPETIQSLIKDGWIVDVNRRPSASQLLTHPAFQLPDILSPYATLLHEVNSIDESTTFGDLNLDEGEELIKEAEMWLANKEIGAIKSDDDETQENIESTLSTE